MGKAHERSKGHVHASLVHLQILDGHLESFRGLLLCPPSLAPEIGQAPPYVLDDSFRPFAHDDNRGPR